MRIEQGFYNRDSSKKQSTTYFIDQTLTRAIYTCLILLCLRNIIERTSKKWTDRPNETPKNGMKTVFHTFKKTLKIPSHTMYIKIMNKNDKKKHRRTSTCQNYALGVIGE